LVTSDEGTLHLIIGLSLLRHPSQFSVRFFGCPVNIGARKPPNIASSATGPIDFEHPVFRLGEKDAGNAAFGEAPRGETLDAAFKCGSILACGGEV
jgi:hypothetical protein